MSSPNSSDQAPLNLTQKLEAENSSPFTQDFSSLALEYQKWKKALKTLAQEQKIDLETWYLIIQNTKQIGNKYELEFVRIGSNQSKKVETNEVIFYSFKENFNNALGKVKPLIEPSTRSSLPSSKSGAKDLDDLNVDAASWGLAIQTLIEFANNDGDSPASLTTTLQIQTYFGLFQAGVSLAQGAFQITQVVSAIGGVELLSLSAKMGGKILDAAKNATNSTKAAALEIIGKTVSNGLTIVSGIFSIGLDIAAIAELNPGDIQLNSSITSLSFNLLSFGLTLTSIFTSGTLSAFAGGLAVPLAGISIAVGALINILANNWESCRKLGEYVLTLENDYKTFPSYLNEGKAINLANGMVIVQSIDLQTGKVQLQTPILPKFIPETTNTKISVDNSIKGDSWETNYKKFTTEDLPLIKTINARGKEIILPVVPLYRMHIESIDVGATNYAREDREIVKGLPRLAGAGHNLAWCYVLLGWYMIGFKRHTPIVFEHTTISIKGSDKDDSLVTPSLEEKDQDGKVKEENKPLRNLLTYDIDKSQGACILTVSKYAKYRVKLGKKASLFINLLTIDNYQLDYQNRKITFGDNNWVEIIFPEQDESIRQIIILDHQGMCKQLSFSTKSSKLLWIDSELYYKAHQKLVEKELSDRKNIDLLIDSLSTIPIRNAVKNYNEAQASKFQRYPYGFYFRKTNVIKYLDSTGKLAERLGVVQCLSDQVILRQQVTGSVDFPGDDFYYYIKKDDGSFKIEFSGQPHSQTLAYLITGKVPTPRKGILKNGCPICHSGNIQYSRPNVYVDPLRCLDCDYEFPQYRPNAGLHDSGLLPTYIEEVHSSLLEWSRGSDDVYYNYVNLVIEASESNYYAEEQKENIQQFSQQISQKLNSLEGKEKLALLKQTYLDLPILNQKDYVRQLLRPPIANLIDPTTPTTTPTTPITPTQQLSEPEKQQIYRDLFKWSGSSGVYYEYLNMLKAPFPNDKMILIMAEKVTRQLNSDRAKLSELIQVYQKLLPSHKNYVREFLRPPIANLLPQP